MKSKEFLKKNKRIILLSFFIFSFSLCLMCFLRKDPDFYWHLKAGNYMIDHHCILKKDVFSWIVFGKPWISHEWLFEILLAFLSRIFPHSYTFLYCFISFLLLEFILFLPRRKEYLKNIPFSLLWIVFSVIVGVTLAIRPQMLSYILLAITLSLLYNLWNNPTSLKIYFLPLISLIWANVHGGSSNLVYLLCLVFFICGLFQFNFSKIEARRCLKKQLYRYGIVFFLVILTICINPHGLKMLTYPYINMSNHFMLKTIVEWRPSDLNELSHYLYFGFVLFCLMVFLFSKKKIKFIDFILFLFFLYLGLKSVRFWGFTYIFMSLIIFYYVSPRKEDKHTNLLIFIAGLCFLCLFARFYGKILMGDYSIDKEIISKIKEEKPQRLFNYYDYGGYLVNKEIPVFVDGRCDLYSEYNYKDYYKINNLLGDYEKLLKKYDFDYFLVPKDSPIAMYMHYNKETYQVLIKKKKVILYKKN